MKKMKTMEFKKLELKPQGNWFQRNIWTAHGKKTMLFVLFGGLISLVVSYLSGDITRENLSAGTIVNAMWFGGFMGFLLTNSPCARGRC